MSIRINFDVLISGDIIYRNKTIGTISYSADLSDRNTFVEYFRTGLPLCPENLKESWMDNFDELYLRDFGFIISRKEIYK